MSSSSGSSSLRGGGAAPARIQPADATYKSLVSLLASPAASASAHVDLIPADGLSSSITHYLATLPTEESAQFAKVLSTSNALWSAQTSLLQRSKLLFEATARSVLARIHVILNERKGSLNWSSRRALVSWIRGIADAVHLDAGSLPSSCEKVALSSLSIHTGLVAGLQAFKAQRTQSQNRSLNVLYALDRAEDEWCVTLAECVDTLAAEDLPLDEWEAEFRKASLQSISSSSSSPVNTATLYLAAQVAPFVSSKKLSVLPNEPLMNVLAATLLGLFEESRVLDTIREDVAQSPEGLLTLGKASPTSQRAAEFASHPLFSLLGPLSRMLSLALSNATRTLSPLQLQDRLCGEGAFLSRMRIVARQWQAKWLSCRLAGAREEEIEVGSRVQTTQLWSIFKTLLFSYTMIFDALMEAIVDVCPSPTLTLPPSASSTTPSRWPPSTTSNLPATYLELTSTILQVYSHLSWITATFGSSTFDAYRRVFYEALEVLARDSQACVRLVEQIAPQEKESRLQVNAGRRAATTYYLDVVEQSMAALPDEMIVHDVLPFVKDYLEHAEYQDSFESAHSVILSVFASQKEAVLELTAYYINLLLTSYPTHLKEEQLLHAYSTVVDAISDRSDTVTWYALECLWKAIEEERIRVYSPTQSVEPGESESRRRQLSYIYVAQLPNVNLVLLRSMLSKIKLLVLQEKQDTDERREICEKVFDCLAGLDASTREEGLRWWAQERRAFGV